MYFVYFLKSLKSAKFYIGYTSDLKKRLVEHNSRKNCSTKEDTPWKLIYYEAFESERDALMRERRLKYDGRAKVLLKRRLQNSLS